MKTKKLKLALAAAVFGLFVSCNMSAQNRERGQEKERPTVDELFELMDENEDGKLSKKEIKGPLKRDFDKVDANEDGFISKEELEKAPRPERRERRQ